MARKKWTKAARLISNPRAEAQLVRGSAFLKAKKNREALAALNKARGKTDHLNDVVELKRAQALMALDRPEDVLVALEAIKMPMLVGVQFNRLKARALRESGQIDDALVVYDAMLKSEQSSEIPVALLGLARLYSDRKSPKDTLDYIKRLDIEYPTHWTTKKARVLALTTVATHPSLMGRGQHGHHSKG